jgi:hypothetical protein
VNHPGDSEGITRCPELAGEVCLLAPCHVRAGLRVRLDAGRRLVVQCAACGWPVLVLAVHSPGDAGSPGVTSRPNGTQKESGAVRGAPPRRLV